MQNENSHASNSTDTPAQPITASLTARQINKCRECETTYDPCFGSGGLCPDHRKLKIDSGIINSLRVIPERYQGANYAQLSGLDKHIAKCRTYAGATVPSQWLTIGGNSGTGKTHLAACIVREMARRCVATFGWINAGEFSLNVHDLINRGGLSAYIHEQTSPDVLVFDDLGVEGTAESVRVAIYTVLNHRYERRKRTIITTNLRMTDLTTKLGQQVSDRLVRTGTFIRIDGESYAWQKLISRKNGTGPAQDSTPSPGSID